MAIDLILKGGRIIDPSQHLDEVADIGFAVLLYVCARSRWLTVGYWLNPAVLLDGSVLGYLDPMYILPAAGALVAGISGYPALAGALVAAAVLTKAQAVFVVPAVVLSIAVRRSPDTNGTSTGHVSDMGRMVVGAAAATAVAVLPVAIAGGLPNMLQALSRLAAHDMLSANACNLWWIVGYLVRVRASIDGLGAWGAVTAPARIVGITRMTELGYPNARILGVVLTLAAASWALWVGRHARTLPAVAGVAAFLIHAYSTLSAQVHENHLFAAVPFALLASADQRAYRPIAAGLSAVVALNLNLFYGLGNGSGYALPRHATIVDASVVLAVLNCALLWRHARTLRAACSTAAAFHQSPAPGYHPAPADRTDSSATRT